MSATHMLASSGKVDLRHDGHVSPLSLFIFALSPCTSTLVYMIQSEQHDANRLLLHQRLRFSSQVARAAGYIACRIRRLSYGRHRLQ